MRRQSVLAKKEAPCLGRKPAPSVDRKHDLQTKMAGQRMDRNRNTSVSVVPFVRPGFGAAFCPLFGPAFKRIFAPASQGRFGTRLGSVVSVHCWVGTFFLGPAQNMFTIDGPEVRTSPEPGSTSIGGQSVVERSPRPARPEFRDRLDVQRSRACAPRRPSALGRRPCLARRRRAAPQQAQHRRDGLPRHRGPLPRIGPCAHRYVSARRTPCRRAQSGLPHSPDSQQSSSGSDLFVCLPSFADPGGGTLSWRHRAAQRGHNREAP